MGHTLRKNLINFYFKSIKNKTGIFGSSFINGRYTKDYEKLKYILNRLINNLVKLIVQIRCNNITNAFKVFTKEATEGSKPFLSNLFNLNLELTLKIIIRWINYEIVPSSWKNKKRGISKMKKMRSRYLFILFYCLIEKLLTKNDFKKNKYTN